MCPDCLVGFVDSIVNVGTRASSIFMMARAGWIALSSDSSSFFKRRQFSLGASGGLVGVCSRCDLLGMRG